MTKLFNPRRNGESDWVWELVQQMADGEIAAQDLSALAYWAKTTRKEMEKRGADEFAVGDRVQITGSVRPKYLTGCSGEVVEIDTKTGTLFMKLELAQRNRPAGDWVGFPISCFTKIAA